MSVTIGSGTRLNSVILSTHQAVIAAIAGRNAAAYTIVHARFSMQWMGQWLVDIPQSRYLRVGA